MIYSDSRYAEGLIFKANDARKGNTSVTVFRDFPTESSNFFYYTWLDTDRIDMVALKLLGDPELWWRIMDYNPEVINPAFIAPGTLLRIPNA